MNCKHRKSFSENNELIFRKAYKQSQTYRNFVFKIVQKNYSFNDYSFSNRRTKKRNTFSKRRIKNTSVISRKQISVKINVSKILRFRDEYNSNRFLIRIFD